MKTHASIVVMDYSVWLLNPTRASATFHRDDANTASISASGECVHEDSEAV